MQYQPHSVLLLQFSLLALLLASCQGDSPAPDYAVKADQKCHVEEVELQAEVCLPTIEKDCSKVKVKSRNLETKESCVTVVRTVCEEEEEMVDNEVCYYVYNKETQDTEAGTVSVDYEKKCEEETQQSCQPQQGYGYNSYCKDHKMEVCYNVPKTSPSKTSVSVSFPVAEKKCENKQVKIPKVTCKEVEV